MTDIDHAAERVRNLTAIDAAFANFMADSSFDSAEEMLRFIDWFDTPGRVPSGWDLTRYARAKMALSYTAQAAELAELRAKLEAAEKERDQANGYYEKCIELNSEASDKNERLHREIAALRTAAAPFEDERPVDEAWLRSIGFSVRNDDHGNTLRIQLDNYAGWIRYLECCDKANLPDTPWEIASYYKDGTDERAMLTDKIETRGQLNQLLAALKPGGVK